MRYKVVKRDNKVAIFAGDQQLSNWWDEVRGNHHELIHNYYVAQHNGKWAIFHIGNPDEPISQWWDWIEERGLTDDESEYYMDRNNNKYAIFHKDNPAQPVSQWFDDLIAQACVFGKSRYYIAKKGNEQAIFHINNPYQPVYQWWDEINENDKHKLYFWLSSGSKYYIAQRNGKLAIFHKDIPSNPVSDWWIEISIDGLVKGQSNLYIATREDGKKTIFDVLEPDPLISWKDKITEEQMKIIKGEHLSEFDRYILDHFDEFFNTDTEHD